MQVEGEITVGEGARWAMKASSRINGHPRPMILSMFMTMGVLAAVMIPYMIIEQSFMDLPEWLYLPTIILTAIAAVRISQVVCRRYAVGFARKALAARGLPNPVFSRFQLDDSGLSTQSGRVETRAPWISVSDVFPVGPYWVLIVDAWPMYLPKRFFADVTAEKAFIGKLMSHVPPGTRDRSQAAVAFSNS